MADVRGVGPYFLQNVLGKGQTGWFSYFYSYLVQMLLLI